MKYRLICCLLFSFWPFFGLAQLGVVDSSGQQQAKAYQDSSIIDTNLEIARHLMFENSDTAFHYAALALAVAKTGNIHTGIIDAYNVMGMIEFYRSNHNKAKELYDLSINQAELARDTVGIIEALANIGALRTEQHKLISALRYFQRAINIYEQAYCDYDVSSLYSSISVLYAEMDSTEKSKDYLEKALSAAQASEDEVYIGTFQTNLGDYYLQQKDYDEAEKYFQKTLEIYKRTNDAETGFYANINLTALSTATKNYIKAQQYLEEAIRIASGNELPYYTTVIDIERGKLLLEQEDAEIASIYLEKSLTWAQENEVGHLIKEVAEILYPVQATLGNFEGAYKSLLLFKSQADSLTATSSSIAMKRMMEQMELEQKSHQKALNRQQFIAKQNRQRLMWVSILAALIIGIGALWFSFYRQKAKTRVAALERDKLSSQLEIKNKEVTSKVMYLARKNELIKSISDKLITNQRNLSTPNRKVVQEVINELKTGEDDDIWQEFEMRFLEVHDSFYKKIKSEFPKLSQNDLRMCAFLRLNLSSKDIAAITFQSLGSIEVARSRLRKKLGIGNTSVNLSRFIAEL